MTVFRFSKAGCFYTAMILAILAAPFVVGSTAAAPVKDLHQYCRKAGNDDTIREYSHALYHGTVEAFRKLFPDANGALNDSDFQTQAQYRCMNGKIMVCFVGANLPCVKMNADRRNAGAEAYCRSARDGDHVSAAAAGHDAVYSFQCRGGKAEIVGEPWALDKRGFASKLWTELPDR
jgi:hypothetical protein